MTSTVGAVATSGVLLRYGPRFVFQAGLNASGDALGVVRLGGHVEPGETGVECAVREVAEEARVAADVFAAQTTFTYEPSGDEFALRKVEWAGEGMEPLLVATMPGDAGDLSVTYMASCTDEPTPGAETQALLFLSPDEVRWIVSGAVALGAFIGSGGWATMATVLPLDLRLRPHGQLRALAALLDQEIVLP